MIGTLFTQYHHLRAIADGPGDDDVTHQADMAAWELEADIKERLNALLASEGVTVDMIGKVFP